MKYPKIKSVKVLKSYMLEVNFSSNEKKIYGLKQEAVANDTLHQYQLCVNMLLLLDVIWK